LVVWSKKNDGGEARRVHGKKKKKTGVSGRFGKKIGQKGVNQKAKKKVEVGRGCRKLGQGKTF